MSYMTNKNELWIHERIKQEEMDKYITDGKDFINDEEIINKLNTNQNPDPKKIKDIIDKSLSLETLDPDETAALMHVKDENLWELIKESAFKIKTKVYDNRIVTFAPLYLSNYCVNNCLYCGLRMSNTDVKRSTINQKDLEKEIEVLAGKIGHKRLIIVYGEHPQSNIDYMIDTIKTIYNVKVKTRNGYGEIRRVNVNAPPLCVDELNKLCDIGIGTYQVFQETYHHDTYQKVHGPGFIKSNYQWRLYCMHRAFEAGIDDVGIGALFGLHDWKFEVMGLLYHTRELEERYGIGPHTISFPRLEPANNTPFIGENPFQVSDEDFKKLILVLRLSVPYTGMILTARENAQMRRNVLPLGITQTDASPKIGVGDYSAEEAKQNEDRQQFILGDTRSLDAVVGELAKMGYITSFCTAGYRCGRTGQKIMDLLKSGQEGKFCKLNAVLTFREWLDDFASEETKKAGETIIQKELNEIKKVLPDTYPKVVEYYNKIKKGQRDLYF